MPLKNNTWTQKREEQNTGQGLFDLTPGAFPDRCAPLSVDHEPSGLTACLACAAVGFWTSGHSRRSRQRRWETVEAGSGGSSGEALEQLLEEASQQLCRCDMMLC